MKKRVWEIVWPILLAGVAFLATGCDSLETDSLTGRLWTQWSVEHYQPAYRSDIKMFDRGDEEVLVLYNEEREYNGATHRRAYLLFNNAERVQEMRKPRFLNPNDATGLVPIPVERAGGINLSAPEWAELTPGADGFRIFRKGIATDWYHLPVYQDKCDQTKRVLLTPLTVTADVAVAGAVIGAIGGILYLEGVCGGSADFSDHCCNDFATHPHHN